MKRLTALALALPLLAAGCGSTVQQSATISGQPSSVSDGLGGTSGTTGGDGSTGTSGSTTGGTDGSLTSPVGGSSTGGTSSTTGGSTSGGSTGGSTTGGSTSGSSTGGVRSTGGPSVHTPLKVGVLTVDVGAAISALGASSGSNHKADDGYRALINAINAKGGLSGRKLVPTYTIINALDNSYSQDAAAACSTMRDAKVEVVLTDAASTDYGLAACFKKYGIATISSVSSDSAGYAGAPWLFGAFNPSYDRGYGAVVDQLVHSGYITPKNKIGVIRIDCPAVTAAYKRTVLPRMKAAGLKTPLEYTVACAAGFQDAGAYAAAMSSAVLKFQSSGVDRVFVEGSQENLLLQYFAENAQNQKYHPGYALSSGSNPITLIDASTFPQEQLPQVHGVGWHPTSETNTDNRLPQEKRCISLSTAGGLKPSNIVEIYTLYTNCSNVFLLEAAVARNNGSASGADIRSALSSLGTTFASTGIIKGATQFGPGRQDGPQYAAAWAFVPSCTCFRYSGQPAIMR